MEFKTTNGQKEVIINAASFKDAVELKKAAMKSLLDAGVINDLNFDKLQNINGEEFFKKLGEVIINMDVSETFNRAAFSCLSTCIYDGFHKIDERLFDDIPEAREDYYEIVSKCCEVNLRPFFKSLVSALTQRFQALIPDTPEQQ